MDSLRLYDDAFLETQVVFAPPVIEQRCHRPNISTKATADIDTAISTAPAARSTSIQEYRTRLIADVVTGKLDVRAAAAGSAGRSR